MQPTQATERFSSQALGVKIGMYVHFSPTPIKLNILCSTVEIHYTPATFGVSGFGVSATTTGSVASQLRPNPRLGSLRHHCQFLPCGQLLSFKKFGNRNTYNTSRMLPYLTFTKPGLNARHDLFSRPEIRQRRRTLDLDLQLHLLVLIITPGRLYRFLISANMARGTRMLKGYI